MINHSTFLHFRLNAKAIFTRRFSQVLGPQETTEPSQEKEDDTDSGKILIVYYSYTGHCDEIVSSLSSSLEADVLRIREVDENADYNANGYKLGGDMMAAIMQTYLFQNGSQMKGKNIGLVVSSASSGISGVESDAKRLIPDGKFYGTSLWINSANHPNRANLVTVWLARVSAK